MEDEQENEIHLSDLTFVLRLSEGMYIVVVKATTSVARNSRRKWEMESKTISQSQPRKYVPQNPPREISSEKCSDFPY